MFRFLKISIPAVEVAATFALYAVPRLFPSHGPSYVSGSDLNGLFQAINFPVFSFWILLDVIFAPLRNHLPSSRSEIFVVSLLVGVVFVASLAAFSYFVVAEIEQRAEGRSWIRASNLWRQGFLSTILVILAACAILLCFRDGFFSAGPIRTSNYYILLRGVILIGWALVIGGIAIRDLLVVAGRRMQDQSA